MKKMLYSHWWKLIGVLLLLYVFTSGFLVPLRPGVVGVEPIAITGGQNQEVTIFAYNTHFDDSDRKISAYVKLDSVSIRKADRIHIVDRKTLKATFNLPNSLPNNDEFVRGTLVIEDSQDGYMVMPSAFTIHTSKDTVQALNSLWDDHIDRIHPEWSFSFPFRGILYETIRNTFFHVAIWFAMFVLLIISLIYSLKYLRSSNLDDDAVASSFAHVAVFFGMIGLATGSVWAKNTWGVYWTNDPKLNMSLVALMIYLAYSILRSSITNDDRRAQIGAAYNVFAFVAMIPLIFIVPRMTSSLHPGNGGNPALGGEDLDSTLRMVFYPAIIGLTILGAWISSLLYRIRRIQLKLIDQSL
jgi:heme exporter protein C